MSPSWNCSSAWSQGLDGTGTGERQYVPRRLRPRMQGVPLTPSPPSSSQASLSRTSVLPEADSSEVGPAGHLAGTAKPKQSSSMASGGGGRESSGGDQKASWDAREQ